MRPNRSNQNNEEDRPEEIQIETDNIIILHNDRIKAKIKLEDLMTKRFDFTVQKTRDKQKFSLHTLSLIKYLQLFTA